MSERIKAENADTWLELVFVLDRFTMEAWRSGMKQREQEIVKLLEEEKAYWIRISHGRPNEQWRMMQEVAARLGNKIALITEDRQKDNETVSPLHKGSCCAQCAWDVNGICCCIPEREGGK